jgi:predicted HD phosphohydrolase
MTCLLHKLSEYLEDINKEKYFSGMIKRWHRASSYWIYKNHLYISLVFFVLLTLTDVKRERNEVSCFKFIYIL